MKIHQVNDDFIRISLFLFSLADKVEHWYQVIPPNIPLTWDELCDKFLHKFFPQYKINQRKTTIATFTQGVDEPLCEDWEQFNSLLRQCPTHGLDDGGQINTFLVGLRPQTKLMALMWPIMTIRFIIIDLSLLRKRHESLS